ncbi:hypothetical protein BDR07DRAFT_1494625 [Suillus spraguei]|nr:hypothetical protein BDR07DRAFT_1494625 [Suillus spraguei]
MSEYHRALHEPLARSFSIWDAAHIFEYAASRFTAIHIAQLAETNRSNSYQYSFVKYIVWEAERFVIPIVSICAAMNINATMPTYLSEVLLLITAFLTNPQDHRALFDAFEAFPHDELDDPMDSHRVVGQYHHCWWSYRFDMVPFALPLRIPLPTVKEFVVSHFAQRPAMALMIPPPVTHSRSQDPLVQQLYVLRAEVARLGEQLRQVLRRKLEATGEAIVAMDRLGGSSTDA